jgi:hypothetical protein
MKDKTIVNINGKSCGCGGCIMFVLFVFLLFAIFAGVTIGDHKWKINLFPPSIVDLQKKEG